MRKLVASCSAVLIASRLCSPPAAVAAARSRRNPLTTSPGGGASSSNDDLSKLVADANKQKFKITYTDDSGDAQVYAQDGNGNSVFGSGDSMTFISKDATISCNKNDGKDECTQSPVSVGALGNPFVGILTRQRTYFTALGGKLGDTSSQTIAGRDATCVTFSAKDLAGRSAARSRTRPARASRARRRTASTRTPARRWRSPAPTTPARPRPRLTVTKFETPSDSDFTPPATPTTVPGLGSITLPGGGAITLPSIPGGG